MRFIYLVCGILWSLYSLAALAVNMSIHTVPGKTLTGKIYAYIFIFLGMIAGFLFVVSFFRNSRRKENRLLESGLVKLLVTEGFSCSIINLSMYRKLPLNKTISFVEKRISDFNGKLKISDKGIITYGINRLKKKENE